MFNVHAIRLRDPWEARTLPDGRTEHRRRFGRPPRHDAAETVWLVCDALPADGAILLNGESLGSAACEVGSRLLPHNEVAIILPVGTPLGGVRLEIRTPD